MEIYLDNCATTKVRKEVLDEMIDVLTVNYANPSSLHRMGLNIEKSIACARKYVAKLINVNENEILFTSGGTESNNIAIYSHVNRLNKLNSNIVTTKIEHASIYNIFNHYSKNGYDVRYLDVDNNGFITVESLDKLVDEHTGLISIIYVNNEIGTVQNLSEIVKFVKKRNPSIKVHVDAIQAFGKILIDAKKLDIDTLSFSSHKVHGPKGVGGLYVKSKSSLESLMYGGGQENGLRPGTENTPGIIGFGKACELIANNFDIENNKLNELKREFCKKLIENIDDIKINSLMDENGAPHILSVAFDNVKAEVLLHYLENYEIYVSTGAACSSKSKNVSNTLKSIGLNDKLIQGTIRISFGYFNNFEQIDYAVSIIKKCVEEIRSIMK